MLWEALLALWHHFWDELRHLGVTFGAFWMYFSYQKSDWGAKGAQRGGVERASWGSFHGHAPNLLPNAPPKLAQTSTNSLHGPW